MRFLTRRPSVNTVLLIIFAMAWLYTEIDEYGERHAIYMEFKRFQEVGKRFTAEDGKTMEVRIEKLEQQIDELTGD